MFQNEKILICHVVTKLDTGGMENGIVNLSNNHDREKFEVVICCLNESGEMAKRLKSDVRLHVLGEQDGFSLMRGLRVAKFFKNVKPDIVHTHGWGGGSFYGIGGARVAGVPAIINGEHGTFFLKPHQILIQKVLSAMCDVTLSVSESLKKRIVQNLGIAPDKIKVIPNGVDTDVFTGNYDYSCIREELLQKHKVIIDDNTIIIGCIGSLKPEKNQMMLLKALGEVNSREPDNNIRVLIIGDGIDRTDLKRFVVDNGHENHVAFLGNRDDIPQLLSAMDIFVSTSISRHEGMSNVILEAMASGLPVVATKSIGTSELVIDGVNGFLVDQDDALGLADKIGLLSSDIGLRKRMGNSARNLIKNKYSISKMVSDYEDLYFDILKGRKI